ncbi:GDSL-like Lipase/Acylhydrolase [Diplogelasinospora grovesii]|uniref:GDSL-like Lipase/Acylhydrolase n=1 Tax=Diplogelasinospora grovesii TaxID=303347 RepID=A0AAN6S0B1_9PEZI|nr:GDSL-like Lipase/Acylhydrolase [Diplogelasinospora grovesii]
MKLTTLFLLLGSALADPCRTRTVWLCGDSTMAPGGGHNGTEGWGQYLHYSFGSSIRVNNSAYAGRSARTFTREGRFQAIMDKITPGDWVVIEFGHNDGGTPATDTKYRVDCPGMGSETCPVTYNNQTEIVQTYVTYLRNASSIFLSKGAKVIISSPTPNNPYEFGNYSWTPTIYQYYSWYVAQSLGGPEAGIYYVNHGDYAAQAVKLLGPQVAAANYPMDHTHLSPHFADLFAQAFVLGLKCGTAPLQGRLVNATSRIEGPVLGTCLSVNATLPI